MKKCKYCHGTGLVSKKNDEYRPGEKIVIERKGK